MTITTPTPRTLHRTRLRNRPMPPAWSTHQQLGAGFAYYYSAAVQTSLLPCLRLFRADHRDDAGKWAVGPVLISVPAGIPTGLSESETLALADELGQLGEALVGLVGVARRPPTAWRDPTLQPFPSGPTLGEFYASSTKRSEKKVETDAHLAHLLGVDRQGPAA